MADVFGIITGTVDMATTFIKCIEALGHFDLGSSVAKDFHSNVLLLNLTKMRLARWGEAVNVYKDPQLGNPNATKQEIEAAKNTLLQIIVLFEDSEKLTKYLKTDEAGPSTDTEQSHSILKYKMQTFPKRPKDSSSLKIGAWMPRRIWEFDRLINDVTRLLECLEAAFPAPKHTRELVEKELAQAEKERHIKFVENTVDGLAKIAKAKAQGRGGHTYKDIVVTDHAKVLNGNLYAPNWNGKCSSGSSHRYESIKASGYAKVLNGDKFGSGDFFEEGKNPETPTTSKPQSNP